jgi:hypothetical protein
VDHTPEQTAARRGKCRDVQPDAASEPGDLVFRKLSIKVFLALELTQEPRSTLADNGITHYADYLICSLLGKSVGALTRAKH